MTGVVEAHYRGYQSLGPEKAESIEAQYYIAQHQGYFRCSALLPMDIPTQTPQSTPLPNTSMHKPSSSCTNNSSPKADNLPNIKLSIILRHVLATGNTQDLHPPIVPQASEQLRRDEEILRSVFLASNFHHTLMNHSFVARVHALIDLIDDTEG